MIKSLISLVSLFASPVPSGKGNQASLALRDTKRFSIDTESTSDESSTSLSSLSRSESDFDKLDAPVLEFIANHDELGYKDRVNLARTSKQYNDYVDLQKARKMRDEHRKVIEPSRSAVVKKLDRYSQFYVNDLY